MIAAALALSSMRSTICGARTCQRIEVSVGYPYCLDRLSALRSGFTQIGDEDCKATTLLDRSSDLSGVSQAPKAGANADSRPTTCFPNGAIPAKPEATAQDALIPTIRGILRFLTEILLFFWQKAQKSFTRQEKFSPARVLPALL